MEKLVTQDEGGFSGIEIADAGGGPWYDNLKILN